MIRNFLFKTFFFFGIIFISVLFLPALVLPQPITLYGGRIMGGGFGGCTINLVEKSKVNNFIKNVEKHFFTKYNCKVITECVNFSKGAFVFND